MAETDPRNTDGGVFDLDAPHAGSGRARWPEMTIGLFLIAAFALAGAWLYSSATDETDVLAVRDGLSRGQVVQAADLRVVQVATDDALDMVAVDDSPLIVGQVALIDLGAGTIITTAQFAPTAAIEAGDGVLGLALQPGEYPSASIQPGDEVRVVQTPRTSDTDATGLVLVERALVVDVTPIGVQQELFISLSMPTDIADTVAASAALDQVRLVQIPSTVDGSG
jgi:hypothetical protein